MVESESNRKFSTENLQSGDDSDVIRRCKKGDVEAFGDIVRKYQNIIYNVVLKMVNDRDSADDITQSAFIKAYENFNRYKTDYPFYSWVQKIAVNEALNYIKQRKKIVAFDDSYESATSDNPETEYVRNELQDRIDRALEKLKPEYRIIIVLRHFGELSYTEIGEILDVPEKTVKSRLFTARQELRSVLT